MDNFSQPAVTAKDVMMAKVVMIDGLATAQEAAQLMRAENVNALIVKKRDNADAFGIVVINDFIRGVIIPDRRSDEVNVYEIMSKPVIAVPADMNIRYVPRLMIKAGIRIAPVIENNEYIGMISLSNLILDNMQF
ncbi:MAG: CBS domain-containing protein [Saprospiraceae bacterium]|jgi:CBS domain-containing protein|nr:CBS domain-containing protein [Saprospiraceae bacterium]